MSRLIVKNIPKYIDQDRLRTIFSKYGDVTDVKIVSREGKARKFCFIGYKDESAGAKAKDFFNNSFIDTSRITVDLAKMADDPDLPRPWSRYSKGSSAYNLIHGVKEPKDKKTEEKIKEQEKEQMREDKKKKFLEFLTVMKGDRGQLWNDDITRVVPKEGEEESTKKNKNAKKQQKNENKETMEEEKEPEKKHKATKTVQKVSDGIMTVTDIDTSKTKAGMASKRIHVKLVDSDEEQETAPKSAKDKKAGNKPEATPLAVPEDSNKEGKKELQPKSKDTLQVDEKRLFILNLPHSITDDEFKAIFEKYGQVVNANLPKDNDGRPKGFGFITFLTEEASISAFAELDNKVVLGRILHIKPAYAPTKDLYKEINEERERKKQERFGVNGSDREKSSFKKNKKREMLERLNDTTNWNTLFLNPNTILAEMTDRLNIKKSDILGEDEENSAVKVALAETQIINETKDWLQTQGLNLEAFNSDRKTCERSQTVILVKNLPYSVTVEQLYEVFSRYGSVYKVHLPPTKAIAVIEFVDVEHAKNAFKNLSYYEMKEEPLYLEWAPLGLVDESDEKGDNDEETTDDVKTRTLFIKNLNFDTTEETIKEVFEKQRLGKFTVKIVKRPNKLSSGYGFVEFELEENAQKALKKLQHKIIDDHAIQLSISNPVKKEPTKLNKKRVNKVESDATTKIVVRNVAFEATVKEIRDLFKTFGEVKTVRMPKKINGQHRGFAFVEFVSVEEARNSYNALNHTHLYGRKLNLEYGTSENAFDEMTKKLKV